jgi:hypothetical protein
MLKIRFNYVIKKVLILRNSEARYRGSHKITTVDPILNELNTVHNLTLFSFHFNIIISSTSPKRSSCLRFSLEFRMNFSSQLCLLFDLIALRVRPHEQHFLLDFWVKWSSCNVAIRRGHTRAVIIALQSVRSHPNAESTTSSDRVYLTKMTCGQANQLQLLLENGPRRIRLRHDLEVSPSRQKPALFTAPCGLSHLTKQRVFLELHLTQKSSRKGCSCGRTLRCTMHCFVVLGRRNATSSSSPYPKKTRARPAIYLNSIADSVPDVTRKTARK